MCVKDVCAFCASPHSLAQRFAKASLPPSSNFLVCGRITRRDLLTHTSVGDYLHNEKDERKNFETKYFFDTCFFQFYQICDSRNLLRGDYVFSNGCFASAHCVLSTRNRYLKNLKLPGFFCGDESIFFRVMKRGAQRELCHRFLTFSLNQFSFN